jgi:hypothetical protein
MKKVKKDEEGIEEGEDEEGRHSVFGKVKKADTQFLAGPRGRAARHGRVLTRRVAMD